MEYNYKGYHVCISEVLQQSCTSLDTQQFCKVIVVEESDFSKAIEIKIEHDGLVQTLLMVVPYYTPVDSFVAPHQDGLLMMLNDVLCVFEIETASIIKKTQLDPLGTMFEVHQLDDDYILYGEIEIYRITKDLTVKWVFSGRDIFVRRVGNEPAFVIKEDRICLYDFEDNYYEIDFEGKDLL